MTSKHRAALGALALTVLLAGSLHAVGEGRVIGTVLDEAGAPVQGAKIVLTRPGTAYKLEKTTDKKGQFMLLILDATEEYQIHLEKEGYHPYEGPIKPKPGDTMRVSFTLTKPVEQPAANVPQQLSGEDKAILAYNDGVTALKSNDLPAATAKFEEAAALNPNLPDAQAVLAEVYFEQKRHADAVTAADRYLVLKPGDVRGLRVRYDAIKASGDNAKAKEALDALLAADPKDPETAVRYFNEGAERARSGDIDQAAPFFAHAVEIVPDDPKFAKAHYVLGLTLSKDSAKKEQARAHLQKFLQMSPNDPDAETAKSLLDYLK